MKYQFKIRGSALNLFKSFLRNRTQVIRLNGVISDPVIITHEVPQGTVLGPILFLIYINGLLNLNDELNISCFADDTAILILLHSDNYNDLYKKAYSLLNCVKL